MANNLMDENELSRRRRAIYQALQSYLAGDDLLRAMWLWEERFSDRPSFELHGFLDAICTTPALKQLRKEIHLRLVKHLVRPLPEQGPDPWPLMQQFQKRSLVPPTPEPGAALTIEDEQATLVASVFATLCTRFLALLEARSARPAANIRSQLLAALNRTGLGTEARSRLVTWLTGQSPTLAVEMEAPSARRLLHTTYVLACEYYGPTVADRCLAEAVAAAEAAPEARDFSPRELL